MEPALSPLPIAIESVGGNIESIDLTIIIGYLIAITAIGIWTSLLSKELPNRQMGEYYVLLLTMLAAMVLCINALYN